MESNQLSLLAKEIEKCIANIGVMHRIFYRQKTSDSLGRKIKNNPGKYGKNKKIQDIYGIRIALYFIDDIEVVRNALEKKFEFVPDDSKIDELENEIFKAIRCNLIFRLTAEYDLSIHIDSEHLDMVDNTFEVQIRTILSEGWHEIDHDLRYKCQDDWEGLSRENRALNGVYATLETSEWTILKLFEQLAYNHYKNSNIKAMMNNKFRLRLKPSELDERIISYVGNDPDLTKKIYRYSRERMLQCLSERRSIPISIASLIFIMNLDEIHDKEIASMMPDLYKNWWDYHSSNVIHTSYL